MNPVRKVVLAVTGASGSIYALKFAEIAHELGVEIHLMFSETGLEVTRFELGEKGLLSLKNLATAEYDVKRFWSSPASGSSRLDAMVIMPCTMGTLGAIANGISRNLIHRAADCFLKERRPLIVAARETPLNEIHLRNMLTLSQAGGIIFPTMPAFYSKPTNLDEMAFFFSGRVAEFLGLKVERLTVWKP